MVFNPVAKSIVAAVLGGAVSASAGVVQNRLQNGKAAPAVTGGALGMAALTGALIGLTGLLVQSPINPMQGTRTEDGK